MKLCWFFQPLVQIFRTFSFHFHNFLSSLNKIQFNRHCLNQFRIQDLLQKFLHLLFQAWNETLCYKRSPSEIDIRLGCNKQLLFSVSRKSSITTTNAIQKTCLVPLKRERNSQQKDRVEMMEISAFKCCTLGRVSCKK